LFWVPEPAPDLADSGGVTSMGFGKQALYSGSGPEPADAPVRIEPPGVEGGTFVVRCQRCEAVRSVGLLDLARAQFPLGLWLPRGRFDRRMRCPACHKRSWCSVSLRRG
jgi:hypothetical protein